MSRVKTNQYFANDNNSIYIYSNKNTSSPGKLFFLDLTSYLLQIDANAYSYLMRQENTLIKGYTPDTVVITGKRNNCIPINLITAIITCSARG